MLTITQLLVAADTKLSAVEVKLLSGFILSSNPSEGIIYQNISNNINFLPIYKHFKF